MALGRPPHTQSSVQRLFVGIEASPITAHTALVQQIRDRLFVRAETVRRPAFPQPVRDRPLVSVQPHPAPPIHAWIADGLLPATWTSHGWQINPNALDRTVSKVWNWAA